METFAVCEITSVIPPVFFVYDVRLLDTGYTNKNGYFFYKNNPLLLPTQERIKLENRQSILVELADSKITGDRFTINVLGYGKIVDKIWQQVESPFSVNNNNSSSSSDVNSPNNTTRISIPRSSWTGSAKRYLETMDQKFFNWLGNAILLQLIGEKFVVSEILSVSPTVFLLYDVKQNDSGYTSISKFNFFEKNPFYSPLQERMRESERLVMFTNLSTKDPIDMQILGYCSFVDNAWQEISNPLGSDATNNKVSVVPSKLSDAERQYIEKGDQRMVYVLGKHLIVHAKSFVSGKKPARQIQPTVTKNYASTPTFVHKRVSDSDILIHTVQNNRGNIIVDPRPLDDIDAVVLKFSDVSINDKIPGFDDPKFRYHKVETIALQIQRAEFFLLLCECAHRIRQKQSDTLADMLPVLAQKHALCGDVDFLQSSIPVFNAYPVKKKIRTYYDILMRLRFFDVFFNADLVYPLLCAANFEGDDDDYFWNPTPIGCKATTSPMTPSNTVIGAYPGLPVTRETYDKHFRSLPAESQYLFGYDRCVNGIVFMIVNPFTKAPFFPASDMILEQGAEPVDVLHPDRASYFGKAHLMQCKSPNVDDGAIQHPSARLAIGLDGVLYVITTEPIIFNEDIWLYVSNNIPSVHSPTLEAYHADARSFAEYGQSLVKALRNPADEVTLDFYIVLKANAIIYFNTTVHNVFDAAYAVPKRNAWLVKCTAKSKKNSDLVYTHTPCFMYYDSRSSKYTKLADATNEFELRQLNNMQILSADTRFSHVRDKDNMSELLQTRIVYSTLAAYRALLLNDANWSEAILRKIMQCVADLKPTETSLAIHTLPNVASPAQKSIFRLKLANILDNTEFAFSESDFKFEIPNYSVDTSVLTFSTYVSDEDKLVTLAKANIDIPVNTAIDFYSAFAWKTVDHDKFLKDNFPLLQRGSGFDVKLGDMTFVTYIAPTDDKGSANVAADNDDDDDDDDKMDIDDEVDTNAQKSSASASVNNSFVFDCIMHAITVVDKDSVYVPNIKLAVIPDYISTDMRQIRRPGELVVVSSKDIKKGEELVMSKGAPQQPLIFDYKNHVLVDISKPDTQIECRSLARVLDDYKREKKAEPHMSGWKYRSLFQPDPISTANKGHSRRGILGRLEKPVTDSVFIYRDHIPIAMQTEINNHPGLDVMASANEVNRRVTITKSKVDTGSSLYTILNAEVYNVLSNNKYTESTSLQSTKLWGENDADAVDVRKRYILYILNSNHEIKTDPKILANFDSDSSVFAKVYKNEKIIVNSISTTGVDTHEQNIYRRFFLVNLMMNENTKYEYENECYAYAKDSSDVYVTSNPSLETQLYSYSYFLVNNNDSVKAVNYVRSSIEVTFALTELLELHLNTDRSDDDFVFAYGNLARCSLNSTICEGIFNGSQRIDMTLSEDELTTNSLYVVGWARAFISIMDEREAADKTKKTPSSKKRSGKDDAKSKKRVKTASKIEDDDDVDIIDDDEDEEANNRATTTIVHNYGQKSAEDMEIVTRFSKTHEFIATEKGQTLFKQKIKDYVNSERKKLDPNYRNKQQIKVQDIVARLQTKKDDDEYENQSTQSSNHTDADADVDMLGTEEEKLRVFSFISRSVNGAAQVYTDVLYNMVINQKNKEDKDNINIEAIAQKHAINNAVRMYTPSSAAMRQVLKLKLAVLFLFNMDKLHQQQTFFSNSDANFKEKREYEIPDDASVYATYIDNFDIDESKKISKETLLQIDSIMDSDDVVDVKITKLTALGCLPLTSSIIGQCIALFKPDVDLSASDNFLNNTVLQQWWKKETVAQMSPIYDFYAMMWVLYVCDIESFKTEMFGYIDIYIQNQLFLQKDVLLALRDVPSRHPVITGILLARKTIKDVEEFISDIEAHHEMFFLERLTAAKRRDWADDKQAYLLKNTPVIDHVIKILVENNIISADGSPDTQIQNLAPDKIDLFIKKLGAHEAPPKKKKKNVVFENN